MGYYGRCEGGKKKVWDVKRVVAVVFALSLALALVELLFLQGELLFTALVFFVTLVFPPLAVYYYFGFLESKRMHEIEDALPAALLQVASFPKRASMEKIISALAYSDYGALSSEFRIVEKQVNAGMAVIEAFEECAARNDSVLLNRALKLLANAYKSGADLSNAFREVAEDALELQAISKEARSAFALQKYTLLAGGILVPVTLGLLLNVVSGLSAGGLEEFTGTSAAARDALAAAILLGNQVYLTIFALAASAFIASSEGDLKKTVLYAAFLLPASLLLFNFVKSAGIM
jgi:archaellum biogenesis protein FlaJ (TadC family)